METNENFIRQAQKGDLEAWDHLLKSIYSDAQKHAFSLLRDKDLAQDAVQNALIKIYNNLSKLRDNQAFSSWWRKILTNEIYLLLRFRNKEIQGIETEMLKQKGLPIEDFVVLKIELANAIKSLPLEQQQILLDIDVRGADLKEAAQDYSIPLGTVKSRLFRGRARLQETLAHLTFKNKERVNMTESKSNLSDRIYDYLEETMSLSEKTEFERKMTQNPEWKNELKKHKDFLTLLHSLTGRITLTAEDIREKVQTIVNKISDYEEVVYETYYENGTPKTLASHIWFKQPDLYRIESMSPAIGPMIMIVRENYTLSWIKEMKKATKIKISNEYKERMNYTFPDSLKRMAENKTSRILGTEYLHGRPTLHVQFTEKIPELGEMNTHLWMDKDTWIPVVTEYYNIKGEMVNRREAKELKINQGLNDSLFELDLPDDVTFDEGSGQEVNIPKEVSLETASEMLGFTPFVLKDETYQTKHQWVAIESDNGILISNYTQPGEQLVTLAVTQGKMPHTNIPPNLSKETLDFEFNGKNLEGEFIYFDIGAVKSMLTWKFNELYFSCGGHFEKNGLLDVVKTLTPVSFHDDTQEIG